MLRRALLCLALLSPAAAQAHGRDEAPGQQKKHHDRDHDRDAQVEEGPDFRLSSEPSDDGSATLRILTPEGAVAHVLDGRREVFTEDVPCSFSAAPNKFYRVRVQAGGATWEKKVELRRGRTVSLWVRPPAAPAPVPQPVPTTQNAPPPPPQPQPVPTTQTPPPQYVPPAPLPMPAGRLQAVLAAVDHESFSQGKLEVLRSAAASDYVTAAQLGEIVDHFTFSHDKIESVKLFKDRVLDRQNVFTLYQHFTFEAEKREVQKLFGQ